MKKKKLYRNVIEIEVLSEEFINTNEYSLEDILEECNTGSFSGVHEYVVTNDILTGVEAIKAVRKQGTDLEFFTIDDDGYETDELQ